MLPDRFMGRHSWAHAPTAASGQLWRTAGALRVDSRIIDLAEDRAGELYILTNETFGPTARRARCFG